MAKLRKMVTYTDYRWEETDLLTPEQLEKLNLNCPTINVLKIMEILN